MDTSAADAQLSFGSAVCETIRADYQPIRVAYFQRRNKTAGSNNTAPEFSVNNMKGQCELRFYGFSQPLKPEFQRTKDYLLKSSLKSFSTASRSGYGHSGYASSSNESFNNTSFSSLVSESNSSSFDFYSKGKIEIWEIREEFNRIRELNKKSRRITFGTTESLSSKISYILSSISKRITDCEIAIKENAAIFSIDKSTKVKTMISSMQAYLAFELSKTKQQYKALADEIAQKNKDQHPVFLDNSKFSFISDSKGQNSSMLYDSTGNMVRYEEVQFNEADSQYDYIYKNILELGKIMHEFEEVSLDQGCLVDRIDINISATLTTTKKATFDLMKTDKMLRNDIGVKVMRWLIVLNLILFTVLLLKVFKPWKH